MSETERGMMADLIAQFTAAKSRVEATDADKRNAAWAHQQVRSHLESDPQLQSWGIDTVLIGSYKRQVAIRKVKDVDILSKLPLIPTSIAPVQLLGHLQNVLNMAFGATRVVAQDRSIKVDFPQCGLAVDAVPARPDLGGTGLLEIPDRSGGWELTNPEYLTTLTTAMNESYNGEYVPLVKLIRQTRRYHFGDARPSGFYFEILCYHAASGGLNQGSLAALYTAVLRSISDQLRAAAAGMPPSDPTISGAYIQTRASTTEMQAAAAKVAVLASKAEAALSAEQCPSAKSFREILGKNDDGEWVLEMPAGCNEDGTSKSLVSVRPGDRTIPAGGDRRFAR